MNLKIRPARKDDAGFLSQIIVTAGRAHAKKGIWEVILGETEEKCLYFLENYLLRKPRIISITVVISWQKLMGSQ